MIIRIVRKGSEQELSDVNKKKLKQKEIEK